MVLVLSSKPVDFNQLLLQYNFIAIKNDVTPKVKKNYLIELGNLPPYKGTVRTLATVSDFSGILPTFPEIIYPSCGWYWYFLTTNILLTDLFCIQSGEESSIMICDQTAGTMQPLALMNKHVASLVLKFICYNQTLCRIKRHYAYLQFYYSSYVWCSWTCVNTIKDSINT